MTFNPIGCLIGALLALVIYWVGTEVAQFRKEDLVFGLIAIIVWVIMSFSAVAVSSRRGP